MELYRKTYAEVNLRNLENNIKEIVNKFQDYKYYFGVIKADSYGHGDINTVEAMINGGCNYLAVATLGEALEIREKIKDISILCLGVIPAEYIEECIEKNITITINSVNYLEEIKNNINSKIKVHIKINTGMNRLRNIKCRRSKKSTRNFKRKKYYTRRHIYTYV